MSLSYVKKFGLGAICFGVAATAALTVMPARWLLALGPHDALMSVADASGTLWQGRAWLAIGPPGAQRLLTQPVQWQWRWQSLDLQITHPWLGGPLLVQPGWNGVNISAQSLRFSADVLANLGAPWNTLAPQGEIDARWQPVMLGSAPPVGPLAELRWREASSALAAIAPIGSYVVRINGDGKSGAKLALSTERGLIALNGQGNWTAGRLQFQGQARFAPAATEVERTSLSGVLGTLGRRVGDVVEFGTTPAATVTATPPLAQAK